MKVLPVLALLLVVGVLLVGCGSPEKSVDTPGAAAPVVDVADHTYIVTGVTQGGEPRDLVKGTEVRLAFDPDSVTITAGCNTMSGPYSIDGTRLHVRDLAGTEMGCDQARTDQDAWVAGLFTKPVQISTSSEVTLISGDVVLALTDRKTLHPDPPLVGTNWVADAIGTMHGDSGGVASLEKGLVGTLRFSEDGTVEVFDGCNSGSAKAEVNGDTITFSDRSSTLRGCVAPAEELEQAFSAVLDGPATYRIDEKNLSIIHGNTTLFLRAVATPPAHD